MEPTEFTPLLTVREIKLTAAGVAGGVLVGAGAGYLYTKKLVVKKLQTEYEEALVIMGEQYEKSLDFYSKNANVDGVVVMNDINKPDLEDLTKDYATRAYTDEEIQAIELAAALKDEAENEAADPQEEEHGLEEPNVDYGSYHNRPSAVNEEDLRELAVANIFETGPAATPYPGTSVEEQLATEDDGWDWAVEHRSRVGKDKFIIHKTEFKETPESFAQVQVTWYAGDNVLCDERDVVIDNADDLVGLEHLQKFGHGSEEDNLVYVRNQTYLTDVEILYSPGSHAHEVLGQELKHSADEARRTRSRARRFDDE